MNLEWPNQDIFLYGLKKNYHELITKVPQYQTYHVVIFLVDVPQLRGIAVLIL